MKLPNRVAIVAAFASMLLGASPAFAQYSRLQVLLPGESPAPGTITGKTLGENIEGAKVNNEEVILPRNRPLKTEGGVVVLKGNLAPNGAVIKQSAMEEKFLKHTGRAVVFERIASTVATGVAKSVTSSRRMSSAGKFVFAKSTMTRPPSSRTSTVVRGSLSSTTTCPAPSRPRRKSTLLMLRTPGAAADGCAPGCAANVGQGLRSDRSLPSAICPAGNSTNRVVNVSVILPQKTRDLQDPLLKS